MAKKFRYYKKKKFSRLNKKNIFKNRSSKSQAKQIYALNKKVKYIQKTTSPEMKIFNDSMYYQHFHIGETNEPVIQSYFYTSLYFDHLLNSSRPAGRFIEMNGDVLRSNFINIYGMFGFHSDNTLSGDWTYNNSYKLIAKEPRTAYLRIVVAKLKKGAGRVPSQIFQYNVNDVETGTQMDLMPIYGPLVNNVTTQLDIIKNKVIKINDVTPCKAYKIKLSAKKLGYSYRVPVNNQSYGENEILIYVQYVCPFMLKYVGLVNRFIGPECFMSMNYTIGYVDQN